MSEGSLRSPIQQRVYEMSKTVHKEPNNTDIHHPQSAYTILGHGEELTTSLKKVPKGCILIVKAHSGETELSIDANRNIANFLKIENRDAILDPVKYKAKLVSLFGSVAIYREDEVYPEFSYQTLDVYENKKFNFSGIVRIENNIPVQQELIDRLEEYSNKLVYEKEIDLMDLTTPILNEKYSLDTNVNALNKAYENIVNPEYNPIIDSINFPNLYKYSNVNGFRTADIENIVKELKRILEETTKLNYEKYDEYFSVLQKTPIYTAINNSNSKYNTLKNKHEDPLSIDNKLDILEQTEPSLIKYIKSKREFLNDTGIGYFISEFIKQTTILQSELFNKVESGELAPGIFYNFICRATDVERNNSTHVKEEYRIRKVHNVLPEIKNQVSEAEIHRKNLIRRNSESINEYLSLLNSQKRNTSAVNVNEAKILKYYELFSELIGFPARINRDFMENKVRNKERLVEILSQMKRLETGKRDIKVGIKDMFIKDVDTLSRIRKNKIISELQANLKSGPWINIKWVKEYSLPNIFKILENNNKSLTSVLLPSLQLSQNNANAQANNTILQERLNKINEIQYSIWTGSRINQNSRPILKKVEGLPNTSSGGRMTRRKLRKNKKITRKYKNHHK